MTSASELHRALFVALLLSLGARSAVAKPARDEAELDSHTRTAARSLAAQGSAAYEAQQYAQALEHFERAAALVEAPTILLMQARTLVQLGRWVEGADKYALVQRWREAHPAEQSNPKFVQAADAATQELAHLMPRIPKLNVQVSGPKQDEAVEVYVDDRRLLDALLGADVPVDPGPHTVEVRRADGRGVVREVSLSEGGHEEVVILLDAEQAPLPQAIAAASPNLDATVQSEGGTSRNTYGWILLGTGAAAATVGVATGIIALGKKSDLEEACRPGCPVSSEETLDSYRTNRTISYVGFAIGVAGFAGGGYLLLSGSEEEPKVGLSIAPTGARLWGNF
jgi:hypothetical protein